MAVFTSKRQMPWNAFQIDVHGFLSFFFSFLKLSMHTESRTQQRFLSGNGIQKKPFFLPIQHFKTCYLISPFMAHVIKISGFATWDHSAG